VDVKDIRTLPCEVSRANQNWRGGGGDFYPKFLSQKNHEE